ncbi:MAG: TetR/AcrR family transcriptional regulator [Hyphomonadaceae bacterium]|nr:TetR/AcrR family transcriptional regulator [Hyphomonadaceae bacterium]
MLTDDPRPFWLNPLGDARNEAILSAAFNVFQEKGLHGSTMLEIATAAKVSKETLYARFDSKEGLFYALLAWGSGKSAVDPDFLDESALKDPLKALHDYAAALLIKMLQPESVAVHRIAVGEAMRMPEVARVFDEFTCQVGEKIVNRIADALEAQGLAKIDDRHAFGEAFIGLLRGNLHHQVMIGLVPSPPPEACRAYAHRAMNDLMKIYAPTAVAGRVAA